MTPIARCVGSILLRRSLAPARVVPQSSIRNFGTPPLAPFARLPVPTEKVRVYISLVLNHLLQAEFLIYSNILSLLKFTQARGAS